MLRPACRVVHTRDTSYHERVFPSLALRSNWSNSLCKSYIGTEVNSASGNKFAWSVKHRASQLSIPFKPSHQRFDGLSTNSLLAGGEGGASTTTTKTTRPCLHKAAPAFSQTHFTLLTGIAEKQISHSCCKCLTESFTLPQLLTASMTSFTVTSRSEGSSSRTFNTFSALPQPCSLPSTRTSLALLWNKSQSKTCFPFDRGEHCDCTFLQAVSVTLQHQQIRSMKRKNQRFGHKGKVLRCHRAMPRRWGGNICGGGGHFGRGEGVTSKHPLGGNTLVVGSYTSSDGGGNINGGGEKQQLSRET